MARPASPLRYLPLPEEEEPPLIPSLADQAYRGLRAGTSGLAAMTYGGVQAVGELVGSEPVVEYGRRGYDENIREAAKYAPVVENVEDVQNTADALKWAAYRGAELVPSAASMVAGGGAGALAARALRLPAMGGAASGAYTASALPQAGGIYRETLDESGVNAPIPALVGGAFGGALEMAPLARGVGVATGRLARRGLAGEIARGIGGEALTEGAQEATAILARQYADPNYLPSTEDVNSRIGNAAAAGALGGAMFGGAAAGVRAFRDRLNMERTAIPGEVNTAAASMEFDDDGDPLPDEYGEFTDFGLDFEDQQSLNVLETPDYKSFGEALNEGARMELTGLPVDPTQRVQMGLQPLRGRLTAKLSDMNRAAARTAGSRPSKSVVKNLLDTAEQGVGALDFDEGYVNYADGTISIQELMDDSVLPTEIRNLVLPERGIFRREDLLSRIKNARENLSKADPAMFEEDKYRIVSLRDKVEMEAARQFDSRAGRDAYVRSIAEGKFDRDTGTHDNLKLADLYARQAQHEYMGTTPDPGLQEDIDTLQKSLDEKYASEISPEKLGQLYDSADPASYLDHFDTIIARGEMEPVIDFSFKNRIGKGKGKANIAFNRDKNYVPTEYDFQVGAYRIVNMPELVKEVRRQRKGLLRRDYDTPYLQQVEEDVTTGLELLAEEMPEDYPIDLVRALPRAQVIERVGGGQVTWGDVLDRANTMLKAKGETDFAHMYVSRDGTVKEGRTLEGYKDATTGLEDEMPEDFPIDLVKAAAREAPIAIGNEFKIGEPQPRVPHKLPPKGALAANVQTEPPRLTKFEPYKPLPRVPKKVRDMLKADDRESVEFLNNRIRGWGKDLARIAKNGTAAQKEARKYGQQLAGLNPLSDEAAALKQLESNAEKIVSSYRKDYADIKKAYDKARAKRAVIVAKYTQGPLAPRKPYQETSKVPKAPIEQSPTTPEQMAKMREAETKRMALTERIARERAAYREEKKRLKNKQERLEKERLQAIQMWERLKEERLKKPHPSMSFEQISPTEFARADTTDIQAVVNAWADILKLPVKVRALTTKQAMRKAPSEWRSKMVDGRLHGFTLPLKGDTVELFVNPQLDVLTQNEIAGHEMGHAVFRAMASSLDEKTATRIMDEFDKWRNKYRRGSVKRLIKSKKGAKAQILYLTNNMGNNRVEALSSEQQGYLLDFEEWFADETAKWLKRKYSPKSGMGRFFKAIADALRKLYKIIKPSSGSVEQYLESLAGGSREWRGSSPPTQIFQEAFAPAITAATAKRLRGKFGDDWGYRVAASFIVLSDPTGVPAGEVLRQYEMTDSVIGRLAMSPYIQGQMRELLGNDYRLNDPSIAASFMYQLWATGAIKLGPKTQSTLRKFHQWFLDTLGFIRDDAKAEQLFRAAADANAKTYALGYEYGAEFVDRSLIQRALPGSVAETMIKHLEPSYEKITEPMRALFSTIDTRIRRTKNLALIRIANKVHRPQGAVNVGETMWEAKSGWRARFDNIIRRIFEGATEEQANETLELLYDPARNSEDQAVTRMAERVRLLMREMYKYQREAGVKVPDRGKNYFPWVLDLDAMEDDKAGFFEVINQPKYRSARIRLATAWNTEEFERFYRYVPADERPSDVDLEAFAAFESRWDTFGDAKQDLPLELVYRMITESEVAEHLYRNALGEGGLVDEFMHKGPENVPSMRFISTRLLDFVALKDIRKYLSDDLGGVLEKYVTSAVKHTEYTRAFGQDGYGLAFHLADARTLGATDKEIDLAMDYVNATMGTYGYHTAERLNKWFGLALPEPWSPINQNLNKALGAVTFFQNLRYLALATLTSLADPLGIAVRGGEMDTLIKGLKLWLESVRKEQGESALQDLAEMLGIVEHQDVTEALGYRYDGHFLTGTLAKLNDKFFSVVGLNQWTKQTRVMALASAQVFIAKHIKKPNKHSARYLQELNLEPTDVKFNRDGTLKILSYAERQTASDTEVMRDDKVRRALRQFVDEAVLRPNPSMRTLWGSDPHFQLFQYLKSFMYAFHDRILKRWWHETMSGNYVASLMLLSFIPALLVADLIRDLIQHGGNDPMKAGWGFWDYTLNAADRAGLTGTYQQLADIYTGGPTEMFSPLTNTMSKIPDILTLSGEDLVDVMPGQTVYNDWIID